MKLRIKISTFLIMCAMFHGINPTVFTNTCKPVPLIPRDTLFSNPEKSSAHISADGTKLAYLAPHNGVLNVWIRSIGKHDDQPITAEKKRGMQSYNWAQNNRYILYAQDKDGDENYHIIRTDISTHQNKDLTPFKNVRAAIINRDKHFPDEVLITMNKENPQFMDVYRLNVVSGELTMIAKNPGTIFSWLADRLFVIRAATSITPDGKKQVLVRDNQDAPWKIVLTWNFEDAMTGQLAGFSSDGTSLFLLDSTGRNSAALIKFNIATGSKTVIAVDPIYDVNMVYFDNETYEPIIVTYLKESLICRKLWIQSLRQI